MNYAAHMTVRPRQTTGTRAARTLRATGFIPGVIYGDGESEHFEADIRDAEKAFHAAGRNQPIRVTLGKGDYTAFIVLGERDPLTRTLRHLALHRVSARDTVTVDVPIIITGEGETPAERAGLVVMQTLREVSIHAKASNVPEHLSIDGSLLTEPGDQLLGDDIELPKGVELADEETKKLVIAAVYEPAQVAARNDALAGDDTPVDEVEADNGGDTDQAAQDGESMPGGKSQKGPKPSQL